MYCRKCGEENPDNAVFCRNCGTKLIEDVKKAEVIDTPSKTDYNTNHESTTTTSSKNNSSDWMSCCLCVIVVFIVFGIFGAIFHI
ncbi:zinc-ribbon domain-containing protein [uncultured Methanobrevibacter sp.]|jgi:uncharacterized membrane protein YvbJ|uniref:zinc-ribbon domain-containing protein n=1 Tax=uncultured Methanobrevibacter sp. TaxID=253161 RepID=UPI0025FDD2DB|nr:zinc ribbon domain-containing protein [uncultured Methanobrevibacter sp.]MEE1133558.1 zinc-ribbon domain-containing protein [Methanobrevibacter sp.]MEE3489381.1 zinc-ribbon domain-containing protein [Methanobrevibacter sp.]